MKAYIILVSIYYYVLLTSGTEIKRTKELNESLHIHCPCQDTLMCTWYHNNQLLANQWEIIPNKTDLIVPANDWSVYGVTIGYCASKNHTYVITNPGENCSTCLRLPVEPSASEHCVNSVINVTVSTNQSYVHNINNTVALLINDIPCNDSEIIICDESGNDIFHHSFTATNSGNITIEAYTNYWGADWYSDGKEMTIVVCKNGTTAKNKAIPIIISTSVTVTSVFLLLLLSLPGIKKLGALWKQNQTAKPFLLNNSCDTINAENRLCRIGSEIKTNPVYEISSISNVEVDGDTSPPATGTSQQPTESQDSQVQLGHFGNPQQLKPVISQEQCPFEDGNIVSNQFTFDGGVMDIKHCGLKVIVPKGAIESHCVEIKVAVSLFGPFDIPNDFHPVSPYVWIATVSPPDYVFKKQLQIEFQHHADVSNLNSISKLCVLKASCTTCGTHHPKMHKMHMTAWNCHFDIGDTVCTLLTNHFCSFCLTRKGVQVRDRIVAYHYLPTNYELADTFRAEICFCYDLSVCKETIEKRYKQRNMFKSLNIPIRISLTRKDELHVSDPRSVDGWNIIHLSTNKIGIGEIDFRELYKSAKDLKKDESRDIYPPRFITQLNCHRRCTLDVTYTLNLMKDGTIVKDYKFSIYVKGPASTTMDSVDFSQNEILQQEPKIGDLFEFVVPQIKAHWEDAAYTALRYDIPIVESIQKKHLNDIKKCCQEMFKIWLTTPHGVKPKTWSILLTQLKKVEELVTVTEAIEKALKNL